MILFTYLSTIGFLLRFNLKCVNLSFRTWDRILVSTSSRRPEKFYYHELLFTFINPELCQKFLSTQTQEIIPSVWVSVYSPVHTGRQRLRVTRVHPIRVRNMLPLHTHCYNSHNSGEDAHSHWKHTLPVEYNKNNETHLYSPRLVWKLSPLPAQEMIMTVFCRSQAVVVQERWEEIRMT